MSALKLSEKLSVNFVDYDFNNVDINDVINDSIQKTNDELIDSIDTDEKYTTGYDMAGGLNLKDLLKDVLSGGNKQKNNITKTNNTNKSTTEGLKGGQQQQFYDDSSDEDDYEYSSDDSDDYELEQNMEEKYNKFISEIKKYDEPITFKGGSKPIERNYKVINAFPYILRNK